MNPSATLAASRSDLRSRCTGDAPAGGRGTWFPWLHRVAWLGVVITILFPVLSGGIVTSLDVGMAYPTWPGFYDEGFVTASFSAIEKQAGTGAVIEHSHRLAGMLIGFVATLLVLTAFVSRGAPRRWRLLAVGVFVLVCLQGLLGRERVLQNDRALAIFHAVGAQLVLASFVAMALLSSRSRAGLAPRAHAAAGQLRLWTGVSLAVLFVHLFTGAGLRHRQASFEGHLLLAFVVTFCLLAVVFLVFTRFHEHRFLVSGGRAIVSLLGLQLALGLATWLFKWGPLSANTGVLLHSSLATAHLVAGAATTAVAAALAWEARYAFRPARPLLPARPPQPPHQQETLA